MEEISSLPTSVVTQNQSGEHGGSSPPTSAANQSGEHGGSSPQTSVHMEEHGGTQRRAGGGTHNGAPERTESWKNRIARYEKDHAKWMERKRGYLMVVATVILTLTFQIAINPPGGVWQAEASGPVPNDLSTLGTSVLDIDIGSLKWVLFVALISLCTISFFTSLTVILLLICGCPLRNRIARWFLIIVLSISIYCTGLAYAFSILMVVNSSDEIIYTIVKYFSGFCVIFFGLLFLIVICGFVYWILKNFCYFVFPPLKKFCRIVLWPLLKKFHRFVFTPLLNKLSTTFCVATEQLPAHASNR